MFVRKEVINPYAELKKERLVWLSEFLAQNEGTNHMKVVAMLQTKFGIAERTAKEYIRAIVFSENYTKDDNGNIVKQKS